MTRQSYIRRLGCSVVLLQLLATCSWTSKAPIICSVPGRPIEGHYEPFKIEYVVGDMIHYSCKPSHFLFGGAVRQCKSDGTWNGTVPACGPSSSVINVQQSSTESPKHAAEKAVDRDYSSCSSTSRNKRNYWFTLLPQQSHIAAIRVTFPPSYHVNVELLVKSKSNLPVSCGRVNTFVDSIFTSEIFYCPENTTGHIIHLRDDIEGDNFFQLCEVEIFTHNNLRCLLPDVPKHAYGQRIEKRIESVPRSSYHYFCQQGYELIGRSETYCHTNGTWYPPAPVCQEIICSPPPNIRHGVVVYTAPKGYIAHNGTVKYTCKFGYQLIGEAIRYCQKYKVLSGKEPTCFRNNTEKSEPPTEKPGLLCERLNIAANGDIFFKNQSRLHLSCQEGFKIKRAAAIICHSNGEWNITSELCEEIICPPRLMQADGGLWLYSHTKGNTISMGTKMVLHCFDGYEAYGGPLNIVCSTNGTWSDSSATCERAALHDVRAQGASPTPTSLPSQNILIAAGLILSIASTIIVLRVAEFFYRRRKIGQSQRGRSVFHIQTDDIPSFTSNHHSICVNTTSSDEHFYSSTLYEEVPESPSGTSVRTPSSDLPLIPFYADPFEYFHSYEDENHIYAEPLSSQKNRTEMENSATSKERHFSTACTCSCTSLDHSKQSDFNCCNSCSDRQCIINDLYYDSGRCVNTCNANSSEISSCCEEQCTTVVDNDLYSSESERSVG